MKKILKKIAIWLLSLPTFFGTIYSIGKLREYLEYEDLSISVYPSFKKGLLDYLKFIFPVSILVWILRIPFFSLSFDPVLVFLYPEYFLPIIIFRSFSYYFVSSLVWAPFYLWVIFGKNGSPRQVLTESRNLLIILLISFLVALVNSYSPRDVSFFVNPKSLLIILLLFKGEWFGVVQEG